MIEWTVTVVAPNGSTTWVSTWDRAEAFAFLASAQRLLTGQRYLKATLHRF